MIYPDYNKTLSRNILDKYALSDEVAFWLEIDEIQELNPIRDYDLIVECPYHHKVSLDLDTRVKAMLELMENKAKRSNPKYLAKMAFRLAEKCKAEGRMDLALMLSAPKKEK